MNPANAAIEKAAESMPYKQSGPLNVKDMIRSPTAIENFLSEMKRIFPYLVKIYLFNPLVHTQTVIYRGDILFQMIGTLFAESVFETCHDINEK